MREAPKIIGEDLLSQVWGRLSMFTLEARHSSGAVQTLRREVYDHGNAAAVLLCDPGRGTVILTRQYRFPVQLNGGDPWIIEACAGLLDGDAPEVCAKREAEEETGYRVETLVHAFDAYASPGSLTEKVSCFVATYTPGHRISAGGGLVHEGEDIEVIEMEFETALAMIASGGIADFKTIALLQHAALSGVLKA